MVRIPMVLSHHFAQLRQRALNSNVAIARRFAESRTQQFGLLFNADVFLGDAIPHENPNSRIIAHADSM